MVGIVIGLLYFSAQQAEAVTATNSSSEILDAAGKALGASCNAAEAYAYVKSRAGGHVQIVPSTTGASGTARGGIDPELACRVQRLLQARSDISIISGYRSSAYQRSLCGSGRKGCAPPGTSCHQYGLAVDINKGDQALRQYIKQFGLHFPYSGNHIQCQEHVRGSCSPSTPPCAKDGVRISAGDDPGPSYNPGAPNNPYSQQQQDILNGLQNPVGGTPGGTPGGSSSASTGYIPYYDEPTILGEDGSDPNGPLDEYFGDGPPAFDDLLGDFGEFNEGSEVRNVLGFEDQGRTNSVERFEDSTPIEVIRQTGPDNTELDGSCIEGIPTRTILGTVICKRTGPGGAPLAGTQTSTTTQKQTFLSALTGSDTPVTSAITALATHILPVRHLVTTSNERFFEGTNPQFVAYDAYYPGVSVASDVQGRGYPIADQLVAWLLHEDPEKIARTTDPTLQSLSLLVRPVLVYVMISLFGTSGHAVDALLTLVDKM